jgi:hypothetical protein
MKIILEKRNAHFIRLPNNSYKPITNARGFARDFVNYKKAALDPQPQVIKITSCLPMVGGSLPGLRLLPPNIVESGVKRHYPNYYRHQTNKRNVSARLLILTGRKETTEELQHNVVSSTSRLRELTALVVIGTDCIGSCKSNYHMNTATTALR